MPAVRLEITAGPDAGAGVRLPPGRWVVGRDADGLSLTDPGISRQHLELRVAADGSVVATDLASTNGTTLDEAPLPVHQPMPWPPGAVLRAGSTTLVHGRTHAEAATAMRPDGTTIVNRPPRLDTGDAQQVVVFPSLPTPAATGRLPLLASFAPLVAGVVLALVMHRWEFLAFAIMSPLVVLGQALTDRWGARRANRAAAREHAAATALAEQQLAAAVAAEARLRHDRSPDLAALARAATDCTRLLWHRGKDDAMR